MKKAFTLIELLIFMGIFSGLTLVCTQILVSTVEIQTESKALSNVQLDGNYIINRLSYDLTRADSISAPAAPGIQSGTLQLDIGGSNYTYSLNSGVLSISHPNGTDRINGYDSSISDLTFLRLGNANGKNTIKVNFTVTGLTDKISGEETRSFQTTIGSR